MFEEKVPEATEKLNPERTEKLNPPVRLVLGRKPLWVNKERTKLKKHFEELKQDIATGKQKDVDDLIKNIDLKTGLEVLKNMNQNVHTNEDSLDSSENSSEDEIIDESKLSEEKRKKREEQSKIYKAFLNPAGIVSDDKMKESKAHDDAVQEEIFESIKKAYKSNYKYVTGWGQSQDSCLMLQ